MGKGGMCVIKARYGSEVRKAPVYNQEMTYNELLLMLERVFGGRVANMDTMMIKYVDEDGDFVSMGDDADLQFAMQQHPDQLKLVLSGSDESMPQGEACKYRLEWLSLRGKIDELIEKMSGAENGTSNTTCNQVSQTSHIASSHVASEPAVEASEFDPLHNKIANGAHPDAYDASEGEIAPPATIQPSVHEQVPPPHHQGSPRQPSVEAAPPSSTPSQYFAPPQQQYHPPPAMQPPQFQQQHIMQGKPQQPPTHQPPLMQQPPPQQPPMQQLPPQQHQPPMQHPPAQQQQHPTQQQQHPTQQQPPMHQPSQQGTPSSTPHSMYGQPAAQPLQSNGLPPPPMMPPMMPPSGGANPFARGGPGGQSAYVRPQFSNPVEQNKPMQPPQQFAQYQQQQQYGMPQ